MSLTADLDVDLVELAPFVPAGESSPAPLREVTFRADAWLAQEDAILREMFAADAGFDEIADRLGRGRGGIADRAYKLGLRRNSARPWNALEDEFVVQHYGTAATADIAQMLGRSCTAIYARAGLLGLTEGNDPPWTPWEDAQLREGYARALPVGQVAALIGRTMSAANSRASKLGIRHPHQPGFWSDMEMQRALELAEEGHRYVAIIDMLARDGFPRRSKSAFGQRIRILGYGRGWGRRWTAEEEDLLRQAYRTGASLRQLANRLGRSHHSLKWAAEKLGLQGTHPNEAGFRQGPNWTAEEDEFLRRNYGKMKTAELAAALGRPKGGIFNRAWKVLGLVHGYWRPYTQEELRAFAIAYDRGIAIADLAIALERHPMTVSKYATDKLSLHFGRRARRSPPLGLAEILAIDPSAAAPVPRSKKDGPGRGRYQRPQGDTQPQQDLAPAEKRQRRPRWRGRLSTQPKPVRGARFLPRFRARRMA